MTQDFMRLLQPPLINLAQAVFDGAQSVVDSSSVLLQYGALGVLALLAVVAVRVLFQQQVKSLDVARARADRLEAEVLRINADIRDRYIASLTDATRATSEATKAISEALDVIRELRRRQ